MGLMQGQRSSLTLTAARRRVKSAACLLFALVAIPTRAQLTEQTQAEQTQSEQTQTGQITASDGSSLPYSIRLLPLASFPDLPANIGRVLVARGCLVPQTYEAHEPENVIHGAFERPGSSDWAVLCSVRGTSSLLVFFASNPSRPITLASSKNTDWLAIEGDQVRGFAWGLDPAAPSELPAGLSATHDAIRDAFIEHTAKFHYYTGDHWLTADQGD